MSKEKLGIVFCTSQEGATQETFDRDLFRQSVLDPVYELLTTVPDVHLVLCVTPFDTSFSESEVSWNEVIPGEGVLPQVCTPTSHAIVQYSCTWPKYVRERLLAYNTPWKTAEDCAYDGASFIKSLGITKIIVVPYGTVFPMLGHILALLIDHCSNDPIML